MQKKAFAVTLAVLASVASMGFAAPQTSWDQGEWQLNAGAWAPKAKFDGNESSTK